MTAVDELIAFLRAQLDEDERIVNEQREFDAMVEAQRDPEAVDAILMPPLALPGAPGDPDRALADVEAKRHILDGYASLTANRDRLTDAALHLQWHVLGNVVQSFAQSYAGRPGWREEWAA